MSDVNEEQRRMAREKRHEEHRRFLSSGSVSSCISCQMDLRIGRCFGSERTTGESSSWIASRLDERQKILVELAARRFGNAG